MRSMAQVWWTNWPLSGGYFGYCGDYRTVCRDQTFQLRVTRKICLSKSVRQRKLRERNVFFSPVTPFATTHSSTCSFQLIVRGNDQLESLRYFGHCAHSASHYLCNSVCLSLSCNVR